MNKTRILFLLGDIWSLHKGQGMPAVYKILEATQNNYDIDIFTTDKHQYTKELPNANIIYFNKLKTNSNNRYIKYIMSRISNVVLNIKYIVYFYKLKKHIDLIYCSSSVPIFATYFLRNMHRIKTIHRIYGTFLFPNLGNKLDQIKKFEEVLSFKLHADGYVITDDGTFGDKVAHYYGISKDKYLFLRNGVTRLKTNKTKDEIFKKYSLPNDGLFLLSVSRLVGWKRVDRIIFAMNQLKHTNIKLIIVGDGEELNTLKNKSENINSYFIGSVSSNEVHELMNVVDVFVSMYDVSNIGNPLLEALSHGLPIITYNSGDTNTIINNQNGILIRGEDESKIVRDLKNNILLLQDKNKREYFQNNARKYADKYLYSWDVRMKIELEYIDRVINEK